MGCSENNSPLQKGGGTQKVDYLPIMFVHSEIVYRILCKLLNSWIFQSGDQVATENLIWNLRNVTSPPPVLHVIAASLELCEDRRSRLANSPLASPWQDVPRGALQPGQFLCHDSVSITLFWSGSFSSASGGRETWLCFKKEQSGKHGLLGPQKWVGGAGQVESMIEIFKQKRRGFSFSKQESI